MLYSNEALQKKQQQEYVRLLPKIAGMKYRDRFAFLVEMGLANQQVRILTKSMFEAEQFIDGSDYEVELNRNVFFEAWVKLYTGTRK